MDVDDGAVLRRRLPGDGLAPEAARRDEAPLERSERLRRRRGSPRNRGRASQPPARSRGGATTSLRAAASECRRAHVHHEPARLAQHDHVDLRRGRACPDLSSRPSRPCRALPRVPPSPTDWPPADDRHLEVEERAARVPSCASRRRRPGSRPVRPAVATSADEDGRERARTRRTTLMRTHDPRLVHDPLGQIDLSAGNRTTSRIDSLPVSSITSRSIPRPIPPVGGIPYDSAST